MSSEFSALPWNFEAFRRFINYSALQNAASVLCLFENRNILSSPKDLEEFETLIRARTGLEWSPDRNVSEDINFDIEGNLFRNKARVFTSFFLVDPLALKMNNIILTPFCKALGAGYIDKAEFFKEIFQRFEYPHPAYDENWQAWRDVGLKLKPLIFILEILVNLQSIDAKESYLSVTEFAEYGHALPVHGKEHEIAQKIVNNRSNKEKIVRERSDKVERKIGDIFGFMCMSQFCFYDKNSIRLNLIANHPDEKVNYYLKRGDEDTLQAYINFIKESLQRS